MKTPRDILFEQHQAAGPKLDTLRQKTLASLSGQRSASAPRHAPHSPHQVPRWRALLSTFNLQPSTFFWPSPWAWAGAAAAWMLILGFNVSASHGSEEVVVVRRPALPAAVVKMASTERRLLLNSLLDVSLSDTEAPSLPPIVPRPHSERREDRLCA